MSSETTAFILLKLLRGLQRLQTVKVISCGNNLEEELKDSGSIHKVKVFFVCVCVDEYEKHI